MSHVFDEAWLIAATVFLGCCLSGCSAEPGAAELLRCESIAGYSQAIKGGASDPSYLALGAAQTRAVVAIEIVQRGSIQGERCSGALLAPDLVISAKHCFDEVAPEFVLVFQSSPGGNGASAGVLEITKHPGLDVAMIRLKDALEGEPFEVSSDVDDGWLGKRVVLAGHGLNDNDRLEGPLFVTQEIVEIKPTQLVSSGFGLSGACLGDSGGPMLARNENGAPAVAGVLTGVSATCRGEDAFVRVDYLMAWLKPFILPVLDKPSTCGALLLEGRCFDGQPIWCENGIVRAEKCSGSQRCGWDVGASGYRCVEPSQACAGADAFGACMHNTLFRCEGNSSEHFECDACARCGYDPSTGVAECFPRTGT